MQDLEIYNNSYLIIGGPKTKKSEVSLLLSKKLNIKLINLDREKHSYFNDFTDYDSSIYYNLFDKNIEKAINYIHKYEMKHLNHVLESIDKNVIIDFGNTYTLIDDINILNKIKMFKNIILLYSNQCILNDIENKLKNNKVLKELSTFKINIDNKTIDDILKEIINYRNFNEIL